jgi:hypothetical protein
MESLLWKKNRLIAFITLFVMIMALWGAVEVLAGNGGPPDHLLCYKVKDLAVHPTVQNLGVDLTSTQFGNLTCRIVGNYREFCVPVIKELVDGGDAAPAQPSDGSPFVDRICYEVRGCTGDVPPPTVNVRDQLGQRDITFLSANQKTPPAPYTLCTPAEKCNSDCAMKGEDASGQSCTIPYVKGYHVCIDSCTCVPCGAEDEICCSGGSCSGNLQCEEGKCVPPPVTGCCEYDDEGAACEDGITQAECDSLPDGSFYQGDSCDGDYCD